MTVSYRELCCSYIQECFISAFLTSERDSCIFMYRRKQSYRGVACLDQWLKSSGCKDPINAPPPMIPCNRINYYYLLFWKREKFKRDKKKIRRSVAKPFSPPLHRVHTANLLCCFLVNIPLRLKGQVTRSSRQTGRRLWIRARFKEKAGGGAATPNQIWLPAPLRP